MNIQPLAQSVREISEDDLKRAAIAVQFSENPYIITNLACSQCDQRDPNCLRCTGQLGTLAGFSVDECEHSFAEPNFDGKCLKCGEQFPVCHPDGTQSNIGEGD